MIPPSRPIVSRINDETVVLRWNVSSNTGLPIQFFKVQSRDLGPANRRSHGKTGKCIVHLTKVYLCYQLQKEVRSLEVKLQRNP